MPELALRVSEIRFYGVPQGGLLSFVSAVIQESIRITEMRIVRNREGRVMLDMPKQKLPTGWREVYHPITKGARAALETAILAAYKAAQGNGDGAD
jgi:DNA-binding cell septation regulator SpoVG